MVQRSRLLFLDSSHGYIADSPDQVSWDLNFPVANDFSGYTLSLQECSIPNLVYPFTTQNNKIYFKENGGSTLTATITSQNYNSTEFVSELQTQLNSAGSLTYTVSYDSQTEKLSISVPIPDTFQFVAGDNNAYYEIGLVLDDETDSSSKTLTNPIRLDGSAYIDLQLSIGNMNYSSNGKTNVFGRIANAVPYGGINYYSNDSDDFLSLVVSDITNIDMRLFDDKGNRFQLPSNCNVSIILKIANIP